jgi:hypothetical protein
MPSRRVSAELNAGTYYLTLTVHDRTAVEL